MSDFVVTPVPNQLVVVFGSRSGVFQSSTVATLAGFNTFAFAAADMNQDGHPDIVVAGATGIGVLLGNGDGTFQPPVFTSAALFPGSIVVCDLDHDGLPDVVGTGASSVLVFPGVGGGALGTPAPIPGTGLVSKCFVGDFDGDGRNDLATVTSGGVFSLFRGVAPGGFASVPSPLQGIDASSSVVAEFDGDGRDDIAVLESTGLQVYYGNADGSFQFTHPGGPSASATLVFGLVELSGAGHRDLVAASSSAFTVMTALPGRTFVVGPSFQIDATFAPAAVLASGFRGDGRRNLAIAGTGGLYLAERTSAIGIASQPASASVPGGGRAVLSIDVRSDTPATFRWRRKGLDLFDSAGVQGSGTSMLVLDPVGVGDDAVAFDCVVSNACDRVRSNAAVVSVGRRCPADFDGSGAVTVSDLFAFLATWFAGCP